MTNYASWLECLRRESGGLDEGIFGFASQNQIGEPIGRTLVVIHQRYGEKLSLPYLAKVAGLSNYHFCRVFQRQVGMSPIKLLSLVRMWRAKCLLESTTLSVSEITRQVGYGSVTTFTTRFSALFGVAPSQHRRQHALKLQQMNGSAGGAQRVKNSGDETKDSGRRLDSEAFRHAPKLSHRADEFTEQPQEVSTSGGSQNEAPWPG
ncbi:helix-turn-helix domain-containing protein [Streptomyces sp. HUAS ZL42]|uniref:helix-turn-helix domain-containing protein n=1 Tax=Streptomyces sp. HUAS ZL42 TaxID=3231715 RepID=UPI00345E7C67